MLDASFCPLGLVFLSTADDDIEIPRFGPTSRIMLKRKLLETALYMVSLVKEFVPHNMSIDNNILTRSKQKQKRRTFQFLVMKSNEFQNTKNKSYMTLKVFERAFN